MAQVARKGNRVGLGIRTTTDGEYYDETPILNELPEVDTKVIVMEKKLYERAKVRDRVQAEKAVFVPASAYFDSWNRPIIYKVVEYTGGRDNPLDPENRAVIKMQNRVGMKQSIPTTWLVSGSMCLCPVAEDTEYGV